MGRTEHMSESHEPDAVDRRSAAHDAPPSPVPAHSAAPHEADPSPAAAWEQVLRQMAEHAPLGIIVYAPDLRYVVWSPFMERLSGKSAAEVVGRYPHEIFPVLEDVGIAERLRQAQAGLMPAPIEFPFDSPFGRFWHVEITRPVLDPSGRVLGVISIVQDITERRQAEGDLRMLGEVADNVAEGVYLVRTSDLTIVHASRTMEEMFGYDAGELEGLPVATINAPGALPAEDIARQIEAALKEKGAYSGDVLGRRKDGSTFWTHATITRIHHAQYGDVYVALRTDISARRHAEEALARSEQRLDLIFHHTTDMLCLVEVDPVRPMRFAAVNRRYLDAGRGQNLDLREDDFVGRNVADVLQQVLHFEPDFVAVEMQRLQQVVASRLPQQFERQVETPIGPLHIETTLVPVLDDKGTCSHLLWSSRDVTARRRAEEEKAALQEQLFHAQKMEAVGTLAGGVAHDFNNILGGLMSGLSLFAEEHALSAQHRADLEAMQALVKRGAELTQRLLGFSRRGKYDVAPRDMRRIVQGTLAIFGRAHHHITVVQDFATDLDAALMDHAQIEQALLNLFINAAHAMPDGGQLMVRGENATLTDVDAIAYDVRPGRFIRLTVSDTGTGIDPAILPRIFEPFFTTKSPGHGTGLGLASVYGIIKNHGGAIQVSSALGHGTTFTILLPATESQPAEAPSKADGGPLGQGLVLVVDDEELPLRLTARVLTRMGYEVLTAASGREAVALVQEHGARLSLVVLDLTMPEMSGAATFDRIREIAPSLKVLLASGFSVEGQAQALLDRGCNGFIQKPFSARDLSAKIRSLQAR